MINNLSYQGRLTSDPELKQTQSGVPYLEVTIAWNEKYKDIETPCFLPCKSWRHTAEYISKWFRKGQEIGINGHLVTESWEKDGQKRSRLVCIVEKAHFCGPAAKVSEKTDTSDVNAWVNNISDEELPFT